jgi:maltose alpha-D-glucosyltransferase/alpha-amylase
MEARKTYGAFESDPLWFKDAIIYELRVGAFQDSDADGRGDFRGLASRLDYLQDLGVTALWLLPFCPSPMHDDGYDISDYTDVHPESGTLDDFQYFLREAHRRGLRVVTELVINHTSDQHPWFQRARKAPPGSRERNFYVWGDSPERYPEARIIFKDFEPSNWTWDRVAKAYYWHRFYAHQPDLNFDSPDVRKAVLRALDFWLGRGVDGLRLDAIPYLFERDGTNCENLPETHAFLRELRAHVDARYQDRMLLAEANQWSEDAVAYFGRGDECHMSFHFPVMPRLFMALHQEDRFPIIDILSQTPEIPANCQWALFLRNHDELTLEMVTDEERDYMYRVYAHDASARINFGIRRRLAPLLGRDRRRIELMNALLFSLPGTPVLYYGDEIGMGDNFYLGDRNGVRTPMQWSADRNAGFSRANPQQLHLPVIIDPEYHYESVNVEAQQNNPLSLLWWMKRVIALRKRYKAFGRGSIEFLSPSNRAVLAFIRQYGDERILVVANLSRFVQYVELDLGRYRHLTVVELFGRNPMPAIREEPYVLTLGPHSFFWFGLEPRAADVQRREEQAAIPVLRVKGTWDGLFTGSARAVLEKALPATLPARRWFGSKARRIEGASVRDKIEIPLGGSAAHLLVVDVTFAEGAPETYAIPLLWAEGERAGQLRASVPAALFAEAELGTRNGARAGIIFDALEDAGFVAALLDLIGRRRVLKGAKGELVASVTRAYRTLRGNDTELPGTLLRVEQSNSSIAYGQRLILKLFRRFGEGMSPDLEIGRFLTEQVGFTHVAPLAGALEYRPRRGEPVTLAILQGFVANEGDAWHYTLDQIKRFFDQALTRDSAKQDVPIPTETLVGLTEAVPPALVDEILGAYQETAALLGRRTAELHLGLGSAADNPAFAPEPFTTLYQRSLYQSMRNLTARTFRTLRARLASLPEDIRDEARALAGMEDHLLQAFGVLRRQRIHGKRIRCHGDYHLGQVLYTGRDFVITDFEGEPARPLSERRFKRSPLRDVAGMLRSFDYAISTVLYGPEGGGLFRPEDLPALQPWAAFWRRWISSAFLRAYLQTIGHTDLVPPSQAERQTLLDVLLLEKSVYELGYELNNRPGWVRIPLAGIRRLLESASFGGKS